MPKSYKICPIRNFNASIFTEKPTEIDIQPGFPGLIEVASTRIRLGPGMPGYLDYRPFSIQHDRVVKMAGRLGAQYFTEFTYTGEINAYQSESRKLLLLNGKKADVLSFCATTERVKEVQIDTLEVDMNALQDMLPSLNLVWFKFKKGMIRASALMGDNIEKTEAFVQAKSEGEISTLSFYFESAGQKHPVMVVSDGTVVLQSVYKHVADELGLVSGIYNALLSAISTRVAPKHSKAQYSVALTPP